MAGLFGNIGSSYNPNNPLGRLFGALFGGQAMAPAVPGIQPNFAPTGTAPQYMTPQFSGSKMGYGGTYAPQSMGYGGSRVPTPAEVALLQQNYMAPAVPGIGHSGTPVRQPWEVAGGLGSMNPGFGAPMPGPGVQQLVPIRTPQLTPQQAQILSSGLAAQRLRDKLNMARRKR